LDYFLGFFTPRFYLLFITRAKKLVTGAVSLALNGTTHSISRSLKSKNKAALRVYFYDGYYAGKLYTDIVKEMPSTIK